MSMLQELDTLGKEIEAAKKSVAQLEGRKAEILSSLQKDFGVTDVQDACRQIEQNTIELNKLKKTIEAEYNNLKEVFQW